MKTLRYKTTKGDVFEVFDYKLIAQTLYVNKELRSHNKYNSINELEEEFDYIEKQLIDAGSKYELTDLRKK
ncbi:hypothetical protein [uncultured Lutibacter sp.]|uniref:hypothetical protein n=1 Tax=uncultured Lutibacter sp. TaxID=437739 RepID=UPI00260DA252|nr:hypothetical protein [uncultured Lutibacter sp.]